MAVQIDNFFFRTDINILLFFLDERAERVKPLSVHIN